MKSLLRLCINPSIGPREARRDVAQWDGPARTDVTDYRPATFSTAAQPTRSYESSYLRGWSEESAVSAGAPARRGSLEPRRSGPDADRSIHPIPVAATL